MNQPFASESFEQKKKRLQTVIKLLHKEYPKSRAALVYNNPFQLLIAVILSAQCTDARVNIVTPILFSHFASAKEFVNADIKEIERLIHSTGFYKNKAKNIKSCATAILKNHNGSVPTSMEELITLPGVGRKTANVVLGEAFGKIEGIVVDTHVSRLSFKLGLTKELDAVKIEKDLMSIVPKNKWFRYSHSLILHGRKICSARKPLCTDCILYKNCPSAEV